LMSARKPIGEVVDRQRRFAERMAETAASPSPSSQDIDEKVEVMVRSKFDIENRERRERMLLAQKRHDRKHKHGGGRRRDDLPDRYVDDGDWQWKLFFENIDRGKKPLKDMTFEDFGR
jgi:hypothetical protein